jgi:thiol-disulfide isomerase/thioredoxin
MLDQAGITRLCLAAAAFAAVAAGSAPPSGSPEVRSIDPAGYTSAIGGLKGRVVVVNMWATWCEPCREEFPELVAFARDMGPKGVDLLSVSMDLPDALAGEVIPFLKEQGAAFPCFIKAAGDDEAFINAVDPRWTGSLPATFIYGRDSKRVARLDGTVDRKRLTKAVAPLLESGTGR